MCVETVDLYYRTVGTVLMDVRVNREVATFISSVFYLTGALPSHFTLFHTCSDFVYFMCILRFEIILRDDMSSNTRATVKYYSNSFAPGAQA